MPDLIRFVSDAITWVFSNLGVVIPIVIVIYSIVSSMKKAPPPPSRVIEPITSTPTQTLSAPPAQRLPAPQSLAGPQVTGTRPMSFAEQSIDRLKLEFGARPGPPRKDAPASQSSQSMDQLRAKSDQEAATILQAASVARAVDDAAAAQAEADKPDFVTRLGNGDKDRGAFVAAIVLGQAMGPRRRGGHRQVR